MADMTLCLAMTMTDDKWRPGNGAEGMIFRSQWCSRCANDVSRDCKILAAALGFAVSDARYPQEWRIGNSGKPECSAFVTTGEPTC